jgi:alanine dehydrogenase
MAIVITDDDARRHLSMAECIDAMRVCFRDFAEGEAVSLPRVRYTIENGEPDQSYYANVHVGAAPSFGVACVRAGTHIINDAAYDTGRRSMRNPEPVNWTVVILYDIKTSEPLAFMQESHISGVRVGATSAAAVDAVAREDAAVLGLLGTGRQSRAHCEAICSVRPIRRVKVFSPNRKHLDAYIKAMAPLGVEIVAARDERDVVDGADIICCTTNSTDPVLKGEWLTEGQMVISVVNSDATGTRREVDDETLARADAIIINDWDSVHANNQIELLDLIEDGTVERDHVHLLGDIFAGRAEVKSHPDNIVYYKNNTGLAMQFAAAGAIIHRNLTEAGGTNRVIPREWLAAEQYGIG